MLRRDLALCLDDDGRNEMLNKPNWASEDMTMFRSKCLDCQGVIFRLKMPGYVISRGWSLESLWETPQRQRTMSRATEGKGIGKEQYRRKRGA